MLRQGSTYKENIQDSPLRVSRSGVQIEFQERQSTYWPHIDGLRAVAVLSVVLYHAGFGVFSGGYVGVDVFFVISGYLITGIIKGQIENEEFRFSRFYMRRLRRLFPALACTITVSFLLGFIFFPPEQLRHFGAQAVSSLASVSNIYFWWKTGYFDVDAASKPLLHTWSLSVEEQFYLFWPVSLALLMRAPRKWAPPVAIVAVSAVSLLASSVVMYRDGSAAFFLTPFRLAEFGCGALLVWANQPSEKSSIWEDASLALGLLLIAYAVFFFTALTDFPGWNSLIPCVGGAMAIYGGRAKYLGRVLDNRLLVYIGMISYSLYLVHWPINVFFHTIHPEEATWPQRFYLVLASFALAILMYRYIETPFRRPRSTNGTLPTPRFAGACALIAVLISVLAASAWATGGWIWRLPRALRGQIGIQAVNDDFVWRKFRERNIPFGAPVDDDPKNRTAPKILLVGDSMSGDMTNIFAASGFISQAFVRTALMSVECQPLFSYGAENYHRYIPASSRDTCDRQRAAFEADPRRHEADLIILAAHWAAWAAPKLSQTLTRLRDRKKGRVVVVGSKSMKLRSQTALMSVFPGPNYLEVRPNAPNIEALEVNSAIQRKLDPSVTYLDLLNRICDPDGRCRLFDSQGDLIYFDSDHLTAAGARFFASRLAFTGEFNRLLQLATSP